MTPTTHAGLRSSLRYLLAAVLAGVLGCAAAAGLLYARSPAACDSADAQDRLQAILRDRYQLDSILINDIQTVTGGPFATSRSCTAEVAEIRGSVDASAMQWRVVRYRILRDPASGQPAVSAELGGPAPLAPRPPTFWEKLTAGL